MPTNEEILNKYNKTVNYIDGFCGPGRYKGGEPGSPLIALNVALNQKLSGNIIKTYECNFEETFR